ncbi:hypothetical protein Tco_0178190 [Tanacetum coccineum]
MEIYTESKPKETHSLPKSGIASLAICVPKSNPTVKKGHPMIGLNEWLRSKAQGERGINKARDIVMPDSEDSTFTYMAVSSPFGEDKVLPAEEQPLPAAVSPTADSPGYIPKSDPEEDPIDYFDEVLPTEEQPLPIAVSPTADSPGYIPESDPEEDPVDYPADEGDDDYDDDESSDDNKDDDEDVEEDDEEEEHPAPADSVSPHVHRVTARMSIRDEPPTPFWSEAEVARLLSIPSPPPSPLSTWSSPLPQVPSPPLPVSSLVPVSPLPLHASPTYPLGYRAAMIRHRAEASVAMMRTAAPSTYILASQSETPPSGTPPLLLIPAPTSSPPLLLPSTDHRADMPEVCLPPQKRLCIAFGPREIRRDPERDVGYGITNTWDEMLEGMPGAPMTDEIELGRRMTNLVTTVRQDTDEIYRRLEEAQEARAVLSGRLNLLGRDRHSHAYTTLLIEREARLSRGRSMDASDTARSKAQLVEILRLMSTLQTQVIGVQGQQGPASGPAQPDIPEEAGSSS